MKMLSKKKLEKKLKKLTKKAKAEDYEKDFAMCYSIRAPHCESEFKAVCSKCKNEFVETKATYIENSHFKKEIVEIIHNLRRKKIDINVEFLCEECNSSSNFGENSIIIKYIDKDSKVLNEARCSTKLEIEIISDFLQDELEYENYKKHFSASDIQNLIKRLLGI